MFNLKLHDFCWQTNKKEIKSENPLNSRTPSWSAQKKTIQMFCKLVCKNTIYVFLHVERRNFHLLTAFILKRNPDEAHFVKQIIFWMLEMLFGMFCKKELWCVLIFIIFYRFFAVDYFGFAPGLLQVRSILLEFFF